MWRKSFTAAVAVYLCNDSCIYPVFFKGTQLLSLKLFLSSWGIWTFWIKCFYFLHFLCANTWSLAAHFDSWFEWSQMSGLIVSRYLLSLQFPPLHGCADFIRLQHKCLCRSLANKTFAVALKAPSPASWRALPFVLLALDLWLCRRGRAMNLFSAANVWVSARAFGPSTAVCLLPVLWNVTHQSQPINFLQKIIQISF